VAFKEKLAMSLVGDRIETIPDTISKHVFTKMRDETCVIIVVYFLFGHGQDTREMYVTLHFVWWDIMIRKKTVFLVPRL
jgi:hypothetical protein